MIRRVVYGCLGQLDDLLAVALRDDGPAAVFALGRGKASDRPAEQQQATEGRRADDQPQPKIIDVFISKLRKKLRSASGGAEFIETIPQRGWILRDIEAGSGA